MGLTISSFSQSLDIIEDDRNLKLKPAEQIPEEFWLLTKKDIENACADMKNNCEGSDKLCYDSQEASSTNNWASIDPNTPESCYLFDHLVYKLRIKLNGDNIHVTPDANAVAFRDLLEKAKSIGTSNEIITPAQLKLQYDELRDRNAADVSEQAQKNWWHYRWSAGLYPKYLALCDIARWIYFNTSEVVWTKLGTTTVPVNNQYLKCKNNIAEFISSKQNEQRTIIEVVKSDIQGKTIDAIITNTQDNNDQITTAAEQAKNNGVNIYKKAWSSWPMRMCNES